MDIEDCIMHGEHQHTRDELSEIYRQVEEFGWFRHEEFIRLHCSPAAREAYRENWGEEPEQIYEDFISQADELDYRRQQEEDEVWKAENWRTLDEVFTLEETAAATAKGMSLAEYRQLRWGTTSEGRRRGLLLIAAKRAGTLESWLDDALRAAVSEHWADLDRLPERGTRTA
jgi:hypothetical protein